MAKNVEQKFSIDLSSVVSSSITATKAIRRAEQAAKEAEFQKAIANGLSYDEQLSIRKKQLETEKSSNFADTDYINSLEKSVADTSKLSRFNKYRTNYAAAVTELNSGKSNEETYLNTLKQNLNGITDPELRLEIQNDIATAEKQVKTYHDTILDNQVKKAKYDGTKNVLNDAISRVNTAKTAALINGNEDEATAYDATLSALNSQVNAVKINDTITNFLVTSATRGTDSKSKLNLINSELSNADTTTPIKVGDKTYNSAQQFWTLERDGYLAGTSQTFGDFFKELNTETKNALDVDTVKHGYPTQPALDMALSTFTDLRSKPEIQPYLSKLDINQAAVMSNAVSDLANKIVDVGTNNLTFQEADTQLKAISTKYGVNTDAYRMKIDEGLRTLIRSGTITQDEATKMAPDVVVDLPKIDAKTPVVPTSTETIPAKTPVTPTQSTGTTNHTVAAGDTLSAIANSNGIDLAKLLELNPQFKENPNIIREGQTVVIPKATPITPVANEVPVKPVVTQPVSTTPVAPTTPTAPQPKPQVQTPTVTTPQVATKPTEYTIVSGDTLGDIAQRNNTTVDALAKLNNIVDPNKIISGKKLKLQ
jgi:LysM repeat protein